MKDKDPTYNDLVRFLGSSSADYRAPTPHPVDARDPLLNHCESWQDSVEFKTISRCEAGKTLAEHMDSKRLSLAEKLNLLKLCMLHYCAAAAGRVEITLDARAPGRTFEQCYLPELLANPDISTLNGIPRNIIASVHATQNQTKTLEELKALKQRVAQSLRKGFLVELAPPPKETQKERALELVEKAVQKRYGQTIRSITSERAALMRNLASLVKAKQKESALADAEGLSRYLPTTALKRAKKEASLEASLSKVSLALAANELRHQALTSAATSPAGVDALIREVEKEGAPIKPLFGTAAPREVTDKIKETLAKIASEQEYKLRRLPPERPPQRPKL